MIPASILVAIALFFGTRWGASRWMEIGPNRIFPRDGPLFHRAIVALVGPGACLLVVIVAAVGVFAVEGAPASGLTCVTQVAPDSPAEHAGLRVGDRLKSLDEHDIVTGIGPAVRVDGDPILHIRRRDSADHRFLGQSDLSHPG